MILCFCGVFWVEGRFYFGRGGALSCDFLIRFEMFPFRNGFAADEKREWRVPLATSDWTLDGG